eukprot:scaffold5242_cov107-Skeletonema_dohrnii-CCMP3373.AAC.1
MKPGRISLERTKPQEDKAFRNMIERELFNYCKCGFLEEEYLRDIIDRHELTLAPDETLRVDDYKFFLEACRNSRVTEGIIRCLLEYFPAAARASYDGSSPLHYACVHAACDNTNVTLNIIQLLIDAAPNSVSTLTHSGKLPLHHLCGNKTIDEAASIEILMLLIEKHPEAVRHANNNGCLPIHQGGGWKSPEFCRVLIEACPGSEQITASNGMLPLHCACLTNTLATVEYFYKLYPDAINHESTTGGYPIHFAIMGLAHRCVYKTTVAVDIVKYLLDCDPNVKSQKFEGLQSLLHYACILEYNCANIRAALEIIKVIYDAYPESIRQEDSEGHMPLHYHCMKPKEDEDAALAILKLLIEKCPEAVRHANSTGNLPIHHAISTSKPPEFCRALIEEYPGSERMSNVNGVPLLHIACMTNTLATVEYLYKLHPDAINHSATGLYPIHFTIMGLCKRSEPENAIDIVKFLLDCDPNVKLQKVDGCSLLHLACVLEYEDSNILAGIEVVKAIYDAHPEAIEDDYVVSDILEYHEQVQAFIISQLVYSRQAKDLPLMMTPDENGQLPLHTALQNNVRLGSTKLLIRGNPLAVQSPDNSGLLPLHVACVHHYSASVIQYLIGLDATTLDAVDQEGNTALHLACRSARHGVIALLLDKFDAVWVSKQNACGKLPIDLLWESSGVEDRESNEYTESVFRLLKAYPELMMNFDVQM